jgi:hypothetical protein
LTWALLHGLVIFAGKVADKFLRAQLGTVNRNFLNVALRLKERHALDVDTELR